MKKRVSQLFSAVCLLFCLLFYYNFFFTFFQMQQSQPAGGDDKQDWAGLFWNPPKFVMDAQFKQLEQKFLKPSEWDQAFRQSLV